MTNKILFICTGNYYRSRYAELFFNAIAEKHNLPWRAFSRGLATEVSQNIGPIYPKVLKHLQEQGIATESNSRFPKQLEAMDFNEAELAIALYQKEHRSLMKELFPEWTDRIAYWQIPDLDQLGPEEAFAKIEQSVLDLIQSLHGNDG